jgi:hypothetical protein
MLTQGRGLKSAYGRIWGGNKFTVLRPSTASPPRCRDMWIDWWLESLTTEDAGGAVKIAGIAVVLLIPAPPPKYSEGTCSTGLMGRKISSAWGKRKNRGHLLHNETISPGRQRDMWRDWWLVAHTAGGLSGSGAWANHLTANVIGTGGVVGDGIGVVQGCYAITAGPGGAEGGGGRVEELNKNPLIPYWAVLLQPSIRFLPPIR